jgi:hypothetical protein
VARKDSFLPFFLPFFEAFFFLDLDEVAEIIGVPSKI